MVSHSKSTIGQILNGLGDVNKGFYNWRITYISGNTTSSLHHRHTPSEGLNLAKRACHLARYVQHLAPRIVGIFYNYRSVRVNDLADALWSLARK